MNDRRPVPVQRRGVGIDETAPDTPAVELRGQEKACRACADHENGHISEHVATARDLAERERSLRHERHLLAADRRLHHRTTDRPYEDCEPIHEAGVRGSAGLEDDGRGIGR